MSLDMLTMKDKLDKVRWISNNVPRLCCRMLVQMKYANEVGLEEMLEKADQLE